MLATLQFPIVVDGVEVSALDLKRLNGRMMAGGAAEHLSVLRGFADRLVAMGDASESGDEFAAIDQATWGAMVGLVGLMAGIGDAAGDIDMEDLQTVFQQAFSLVGETSAATDSPAEAGEGLSPKPLTS